MGFGKCMSHRKLNLFAICQKKCMKKKENLDKKGFYALFVINCLKMYKMLPKIIIIQ